MKITPPTPVPPVRDKYKGRSYQRYLDWVTEKTKKKEKGVK